MAANENSIVQLAIQIKNGIMKHVNVTVEIILHIKKDYSWNPSTCICENAKYLKSCADDQKLRLMKLYILWILYQQMWQVLCQQMLRVLC